MSCKPASMQLPASKKTPLHPTSSAPTAARAFPSHTVPLDVGRYILEIAATLDDYTTARSLILSCKLFRAWIEPVLYHTIVIYSNHQWTCFMRTIDDRHANDSLFFTRNVKCIMVVFADDIPSILNACKGLVSMIFWEWDWDDTEPDHSPESAVSKRQSFLTQYANIPTARRLTLDILYPTTVAFLPQQLTHLTLLHSEAPLLDLDFKAFFSTCCSLSRFLLVLRPRESSVDEDMPVWREFAKTLLAHNSSPKFRLLILAPGLGPWRLHRIQFVVRHGYRNVWIRGDDAKEPRLMIIRSDYMTESSDGSDEEGYQSDDPDLTTEERTRLHETQTTETFRRIARVETDAWDFAAEHDFC